MTRIPIDDKDPDETEQEALNTGPQDEPAKADDTNETLKLRSERDQLFEPACPCDCGVQKLAEARRGGV